MEKRRAQYPLEDIKAQFSDPDYLSNINEAMSTLRRRAAQARNPRDDL